jgi:hypothetical protein
VTLTRCEWYLWKSWGESVVVETGWGVLAFGEPCSGVCEEAEGRVDSNAKKQAGRMLLGRILVIQK